jgi:catechol 2,3-dioxygenase-like lactoylglutathione lyase family enzyme
MRDPGISPAARHTLAQRRSVSAYDGVRRQNMAKTAKPRMVGAELYFNQLARAKKFYRDILGLTLADETLGHHARFAAGNAFLCLEHKGAENYPSADKAVVFFEVPDLAVTVKALGRKRVLRCESQSGAHRPAWAVLHDPEGHNILLLESQNRPKSKK